MGDYCILFLGDGEFGERLVVRKLCEYTRDFHNDRGVGSSEDFEVRFPGLEGRVGGDFGGDDLKIWLAEVV